GTRGGCLHRGGGRAARTVRKPPAAQSWVRGAERWNERVERKIFRPGARNVPSARLAATGARFPAYFIGDQLPVWDEAARGVWRLEVSGLCARPQRLTLDELKLLPRTEARLEHFRVAGWWAVEGRPAARRADLA